MLQKLLAEIEKGGTLNPATLAARLGVGPVMVEMMLEDLERKGKLTRLPESSCGGPACGACPISTTCVPSSASNRIWMLAGKGE